MNKDFPRIMKMLRRERGLRQKEAADRLGVAQALLSHYENGKRECGLDFLVSAADFYGVSVDFILGRTSSRNGTIVSEETLPDSSVSENASTDLAGAGTLLRKKLITNSLEIVFSLLIKARNSALAKNVASYLMTAVYRAYRMVFSSRADNDENCFSVPEGEVADRCSVQMMLDDLKARSAAKEGSSDERISTTRLEQEYPRQSTALFSIVNNVEQELNK